MAIYHLSAKVISRGKGQSAIAAAAYRSGEALEDEQTGEQKHYRSRAERIVFTDIMAPKDAPEWAHDRNDLWNEAERAEKRKDSQLAREFEISLPHELTEQQREWLVKDFAREAFVRKGYAVDIAIHAPDKDSDERNHHAHLMVTMRTLGPEGFAAKKDRDLNKGEQLTAWREQWGELANRHLERHGHAERIDHRSLEAQGVEREPTVHVGYAGMEIDARGGDSDRMTALREVMERNDIRVELSQLEQELQTATAEQAQAYRELEKAARADNRLLRDPGEGAASFERNVAEAIQMDAAEIRAERRDTKFWADQEAWRATVDERNPEASGPSLASAGLEVVDAATGAVSKLGEFMLDFMSGSSAKPSSATAAREVDMAAYVSDPAARKEHQLAQVAEMKAGRESDQAIERMRKDMEAGRRLSSEDIGKLTHAHQQSIFQRGDDGVRQMVEDARKRSENYWKSDGRERER
jgi:hypothetical protein